MSPELAPLTDGAPLVQRMSDRDLAVMRVVLAPLRAVAATRSFGLDNIPTEGPVLLVGNHTMFGMIDAPPMADDIIRHTGRLPRGLAEHAHYALPGWRDMLTWGGAVRGTRDNCRALFAAGELVLVYPGGGREVAKRKGEKYRLIWKELERAPQLPPRAVPTLAGLGGTASVIVWVFQGQRGELHRRWPAPAGLHPAAGWRSKPRAATPSLRSTG